jgi:hypothetical protein
MPTRQAQTETLSAGQMRRLHALLRDHGIVTDTAVHDYINRALTEAGEDPVESRKDLTSAAADRLIADLDRADVAHAPGGLVRALIRIQAALPVVQKSKTARVPTKSGGEYTYTYADLADVTAAAMPLLTKNGLAFSCVPRATERGYELAGVLMHESGERLDGALPLHGNDPQQLGGALTYHRRYLLGCMLGIVTDDDADGRQAQGASRTREWDGPSTHEFLMQIDADAARAGVTYDQATAKFRERHGGLDINALDALDPWIVAPLAEAVRKRADEVTAEKAAAEQAAAEKPAETSGDPAIPEPGGADDPWATPGPGASGEQPPA